MNTHALRFKTDGGSPALLKKEKKEIGFFFKLIPPMCRLPTYPFAIELLLLLE
jgi:hypothetical protein